MSRSSSSKGVVLQSRSFVWLGLAALVAVGVPVAIHFSGNSTAASTPTSSASADDLALLGLPPPPQSSAAPAASAAHGSAATLSAEIALVRPMFSDTNGALDRGTASLALWASSNLSWGDLKSLPATSPALFRKDPDQERGRLLCIEGTIQEIRAEKNLTRRLVSDRAAPLVEAAGSPNSALPAQAPETRPDAGDIAHLLAGPGEDAVDWQVPGGKVFFATIVEPDHSKTEEARLKARPFVVEAIAAKSTGTLVDGESARFCGILTGVMMSGNDQRLVHRAVGIFELPENTGVALSHAQSPATSPSPAPAASPTPAASTAH